MSDWKNVFFDQIPTYIGILNETLAKDYPPKQLGEYVKISGGYSFKSIEYKEKGVPIIRISDFQNEEVILNNVKYYNEHLSLEKYELKTGDIIIALTGGTIGKLAIVQPNLGKLYLNQRVGKFDIIDSNNILDEYCYWLARGVGAEIKKIAWGGAQPNVSGKQIEKMKFIFPEKVIQNQIASFFKDLRNNKIEKRIYFDEECEKKIIESQNTGFDIDSLSTQITRQQSLQKKLRQTILQEAIEGKLTKQWREENTNVEPASVLLKKIKAEKARLVAEKKIKKAKPIPPIEKDEIPFEIPKSWEWCRLGEICLHITDGTHHSPNNLKNGAYKYITAKNIKPFGIDISKITYVSEKDHNNIYNRCNPQLGDLLLIKDGATTGIATINDFVEPFSMLSSVALIKVPKIILNKYILHGIRSKYFYNTMRKDMSGVAITRITLTKINDFKIPIPPLSEQKEIVKKADHLFAICDELEGEINDSKANADMLMQAVLKEAFAQ